jgi:hypothetical protein
LQNNKWLNNVLATYFFKNLLVGCQLFSVYHSVGRQLDENFTQSAASQMQIASG